MIHKPAKPKDDDKLWVILAGGVFLVGLVAAVVWTVITLTTPGEPAAEVFTAEYCDGHVNGVAVSLYNAGATAEAAITYAQDIPALSAAFGVTPESFACDPANYAGDTPELAWCNGLAQGYIAASLVQGFGDPPADFLSRSVQECLDNGLAYGPPIPGTGLGEPLGGGGVPPVDE